MIRLNEKLYKGKHYLKPKNIAFLVIMFFLKEILKVSLFLYHNYHLMTTATIYQGLSTSSDPLLNILHVLPPSVIVPISYFTDKENEVPIDIIIITKRLITCPGHIAS